MVTRQQVVDAYRWLLGREPESEAAIEAQMTARSLDELRHTLVFHAAFDAVVAATRDGSLERRIEISLLGEMYATRRGAAPRRHGPVRKPCRGGVDGTPQVDMPAAPLPRSRALRTMAGPCRVIREALASPTRRSSGAHAAVERATGAGRAGSVFAEEAVEGRQHERGDRAAGADGATVCAGAAAASASGDVSRRAGASGGDPAVGGAASRGGGRRRLPT